MDGVELGEIEVGESQGVDGIGASGGGVEPMAGYVGMAEVVEEVVAEVGEDV